jgi:hypothetical protein
MSSIINFFVGFLTTAIAVLAVVFVFNKFTAGGVATLGKAPIADTIGAGK